jgi:hypothetical protein
MYGARTRRVLRSDIQPKVERLTAARHLDTVVCIQVAGVARSLFAPRCRTGCLPGVGPVPELDLGGTIDAGLPVPEEDLVHEVLLVDRHRDRRERGSSSRVPGADRVRRTGAG